MGRTRHNAYPIIPLVIYLSCSHSQIVFTHTAGHHAHTSFIKTVPSIQPRSVRLIRLITMNPKSSWQSRQLSRDWKKKRLKKKKTLEEISPILTQEVVCSVIYVLYWLFLSFKYNKQVSHLWGLMSLRHVVFNLGKQLKYFQIFLNSDSKLLMNACRHVSYCT